MTLRSSFRFPLYSKLCYPSKHAHLVCSNHNVSTNVTTGLLQVDLTITLVFRPACLSWLFTHIASVVGPTGLLQVSGGIISVPLSIHTGYLLPTNTHKSYSHCIIFLFLPLNQYMCTFQDYRNFGLNSQQPKNKICLKQNMKNLSWRIK